MIESKYELLEALELDKAGSWNKAHRQIMKVSSPESSWIHAYLHRKEGDLSNAAYWYSKAEKTVPDKSLEDEWEEIFKYINEM